MWPGWVSNLGPQALESDGLLTALCGPAITLLYLKFMSYRCSTVSDLYDLLK